MADIKRCSDCGESKPFDQFHKNRSSKDGLQCYCKPCMNVRNAISVEKHKESKLQRNREYMTRQRLENPEKTRDAYRRWYANHGRKYHQEWQADNREVIKLARQEWRKAHPEAMQHSGNKSRLKREGFAPIHTLAEWLELVAAYCGKCANCGSDEDICIDHVIPLSKGGNDGVGNIQPLCRRCNASKGNKTIDYRKKE